MTLSVFLFCPSEGTRKNKPTKRASGLVVTVIVLLTVPSVPKLLLFPLAGGD